MSLAPKRTDADIDYTFGQVLIDAPLVDYRGNSGNVASAVGPFAIDQGLVPASEPITTLRLYNTNTGKRILVHVPVRGGQVQVSGDYEIDGVPGSGARIVMDLIDPAGSVTGSLLPTGQPRDSLRIAGIGEVGISVVDAATPVAFVKAESLGLTGIEIPEEVNRNVIILELLEAIRGKVAVWIGLAAEPEDARMKSAAVPKIAFVNHPKPYQTTRGTLVPSARISMVARMVSLGLVHHAYPLTGAIATAAAALIPGTVVHEVSCLPARNAGTARVVIGHPAGTMDLDVIAWEAEGNTRIESVRVGRTARKIMEGLAYVPEKLLTESLMDTRDG